MVLHDRLWAGPFAVGVEEEEDDEEHEEGATRAPTDGKGNLVSPPCAQIAAVAPVVVAFVSVLLVGVGSGSLALLTPLWALADAISVVGLSAVGPGSWGRDARGFEGFGGSARPQETATP